MMTVVAGDILRTTLEFTLADGTIAQNVFHHKRTGIGILTDQAIINDIEAWAEAMYAEVITDVPDATIPNLNSVDLVEFVLGKWTVVENIGTFTITFAPSSAVEALPNMVSAFVTFKTTRPKSVGRKFLIPFTEATQDATFIIPLTLEHVVAWADLAVNDIVLQVGDNLVPGIVRTSEDTFLEVFIAVVTNVLGSQRRRRPGVGA